MSLIGKIVTLFSDKEKTAPVFPRTKVSAVSDDDGVGLNVLLDNVNEAIDNVRITADAAQDVVTPAEEDEGKILKVVDGAASWANHKIGRKDLENDALYSPLHAITGNYSIVETDLGKTISNNTSSDIVVTLDSGVASTMPQGAEIAILRGGAGALGISFTGDNLGIGRDGDGYIRSAGSTTVLTVQIPERFGMIALKKIYSNIWVLTGNVEVV